MHLLGDDYELKIIEVPFNNIVGKIKPNVVISVDTGRYVEKYYVSSILVLDVENERVKLLVAEVD